MRTYTEVEVRTQAELDAAIKAGHIAICVEGELRVVTTGTDAPQLIVRAGASVRVVAWESSQPRVEAWGSSQPRVVARESSQPRVEAWESSQPRVEAWGAVQLSIHGAVKVAATALVAIAIHGCGSKVEGGQQTQVPAIETAEAWCEWYGATVADGVATLYKAVGDDYHSPHGVNYSPGLTPAAADWDGGERECGGGLHFSPHPLMALGFHNSATRFVACQVRLSDMRPPSVSEEYPEKIKAARCCAPCVEVDEDGEEIKTVPTEEATDRK